MKSEPVGARLLTTPRGQADVSVSEAMLDRYYCIKSFCHFVKTLRKVHFCVAIMAQKL